MKSPTRVFAPGCALMLYKPDLAGQLHRMLLKNLGEMGMWMTCCRKDPGFATETEVINICPGCDKRFRKDYPSSATVSLWEVLAETDFFPFPDYDIVVYCVSCSKSMFVGGRRPHYMIDLLFNEETVPKTFERDEWHQQLDDYIERH